MSEAHTRRELCDRIELALARAARSARTVAVIAVAVDEPDRWGKVGDGAAGVSRRAGSATAGRLDTLVNELRSELRPTDAVGTVDRRIVVAVCEDLAGDPDVIALVERVERVVDQTLRAAIGGDASGPARLGLVRGDGDRSAGELLEDAIRAASRVGGPPRPPLRRSQLRDDDGGSGELGEALTRGELTLRYQPAIDIATGRIVSAEALLRWPSGPPDGVGDRIPAAESSGLIIRLGRWTLERVCEQVVSWSDDPRLVTSLGASTNLSPRQLSDPELIDAVDAIVAGTGADPRLVTLEITETALAEDPSAAAGVLAQLCERGFGLSVDDFGTGYSSLRYLSDFPLDGLKIDRSFVSDLDRDPTRRSIVSSVVDLAHQLGLTATAEGVETVAQLEVLGELGCDRAQGFLVAEALEPAALADLVVSRRRW